MGETPNRLIDVWAALDSILSVDVYTRFSLHAHRDWHDSSIRRWDAILFKEKGQILARAGGATRHEAIAALIRAHECVKR